MYTIIKSKGEITIPKEIRERFNLQSGDRINVIVEADGIYIQPFNIKVESLSGILHKPGRAIVSIEQMNGEC
jgi:antitoxin PrlF